jgi:hypothetical protein
MSEPKPAEAVKLVASILFSEKALLPAVLEALTKEYGVTDYISPARPFCYTDYYHREMGLNMERLFVAFAQLIRPESLPQIKLQTNDLEKSFSQGGGRRVNIDPGYVSSAHLILATGKGYAHRPYLRDGIYADLTLMYCDKFFQTLPWTYPDYAENETRGIFNRLRSKYIAQVKLKTNGPNQD